MMSAEDENGLIAGTFLPVTPPLEKHNQVLPPRSGPSELVGLVGENGSGKSTLMQIVVGLLGRDGGELERPGPLGYCPQTPMLWDKLTVDEHFALFAHAYGLDDATSERAVTALLESLVVRHPFRERPRAQLMVALYRCGRQSEALQVYREGRERLAEELGIEPGPQLKELELQILRQDRGLLTPASAPAPAAVEPPASAAAPAPAP
jgi:hypothetical protein